MPRVRLIHWKQTEIEERAARLRAAGYTVDSGPVNQAALTRLRHDPPAAVVIDLSRMPSQGRDIGIGLRSSKATRRVPLVFVDGDPEKVARIRELLPDAAYASWRTVSGSLTRAIENPPRDPVAPSSPMSGYAATPLPKKLGIKGGSSVALIGAPRGFAKTLGKLPADSTLRRDAQSRTDVTVWFVGSRSELERRIDRMVPRAETGGLWIAWPKKSSGVQSNLSQAEVRRTAMNHGLVDFKIAAIDSTWSGLRFSTRKHKGRR